MKIFAIVALIAASVLMADIAKADCTSPAGPEGVMGYFSGEKTYKFCDGTNWVSMKQRSIAPDYDSGWQTSGAGNTVTTLTHNLETRDFANILIVGSCDNDETKPLFVGGVTSSGNAAYGNDLVFDTDNTVKVGVYLHGTMSGSYCGAAVKYRIKLWKAQ